MQLGFVTVRPYLDNEFTKAEWDTDSGLGSKDLHDKVLLYMNQNKDMPFPILKAKTLEIVAEYAQFQINPKSIFADKINVGINYEKTASNSLYENIFRNRYDSILRNSISCEWEKRDVAIKMGICSPETDFWHMLPDWESIFSLGFVGLLKRAEKAKINLRKANTTRVTGKNKVNIHKINTYENDIFYDSVIITYKAFLLYIRRLYSAAIKLHLTEYAECLDYISKYPPKTLYHVLQMTHLFLSFGEIGMERVRSLGLVDRLYYPYYLSDLKNKIYTLEEIKEIFRYFFIKFSAAKRFANQPLAIGGTYADGADAFNELTLLMLDIYEELNIHNPKFHVRCHDKMPDTLLRKLLYMIRKGNSSIVLINDATVYKGYDKIGISRELSVKYVPIGCYEPVIMGVEDARIGASWINIVKAVEFAMHGGIDSLTGKVFGYKTNMEFDSFDGFYKVFIGHLDYIIEFTINNILKQQDYQLLINPSPFYSPLPLAS